MAMRFKMNNEIRGARYWKVEEKRRCRMCGEGGETWEHVLGESRIKKDGGVGGRE